MRRLIALIIALLVASTTASFAHTATGSSGYYRYPWIDGDGAIPWRFTASYPWSGNGSSDNWIHRIWDGERAWNDIQRSTFHFAWCNDQPTCSDYADYDPAVCPSTYQKNGVHWRSISAPGRVYWCQNAGGDRLHSVQMVIDSTPSKTWYNGTGTPASDRLDLWSVAAHEWGHMAGSNSNGDGKGHYPETSSVCPDNDSGSVRRHTLCPLTYTGQTLNRTLESHDIHTFTAAY